MKNVPIKFRGVTLNKSGVVYGDLIQAPCELPTIRVYDVAECKKSGDCVFEDYEVYPESISQLVGYDANGEEVYEGDKIYDTENPADTVTAELYPCVHLQFYKLMED